MKKKITKFLNEIFAPRVTVYYNNKESDMDWKQFDKTFKKMDEMFKEVNKIFK